MALGKEVDLGPGHIVLGGDPVGTQRPHNSPSPLFGPCLLWPNGHHHVGHLPTFLVTYRTNKYSG